MPPPYYGGGPQPGYGGGYPQQGGYQGQPQRGGGGSGMGGVAAGVAIGAGGAVAGYEMYENRDAIANVAGQAEADVSNWAVQAGWVGDIAQDVDNLF